MVEPLTDSHLLRDITWLLENGNEHIIAEWALDCAQHVLPFFELAVPDDSRPRLAILTGRLWLEGEATDGEIREAADAAHAAARGAETPDATAAARASAQAVSTVFSAAHALHASAYAAKAAALAHDFDSSALEQERSFQYGQLLKLQQTKKADSASLLTEA